MCSLDQLSKGVAKVVRDSALSSGFTTTAVHGTFAFMAAELHDELVWTAATDVFALAGTILQAFHLDPTRPFSYLMVHSVDLVRNTSIS